MIGSVYRTLPPQLTPQGSSVLYMLNQLGASIGIAMTALIMQHAGPGNGFHIAYLAIAVTLVVMIAASSFIPGRVVPAVPGEPAEERSAGSVVGSEASS